jgi:DNA methyltransferase 1-associated protein 1
LSEYPIDKETTRKKYIRGLDTRTAEQLAEDEALFIEIKKLEQSERTFKRDRENLLRVVSGIDSGLPDIVEDEMNVPPLSDLKKLKRKAEDSPSASSISTPIIKQPRQPLQPTEQTKRDPENGKSSRLSPVECNTDSVTDRKNCIIWAEEKTNSTTPATKAAHQPGFLRSFKLPVPKATISQKVTQALSELGVNHSRLVMPTADNLKFLEALLDETVKLLDLKKHVDKIEYDINVAKQRLGMQTDGFEIQPPVDNSMDVDDDSREVIGEDGRAQSVISGSGRGGRKHVGLLVE